MWNDGIFWGSGVEPRLRRPLRDAVIHAETLRVQHDAAHDSKGKHEDDTDFPEAGKSVQEHDRLVEQQLVHQALH